MSEPGSEIPDLESLADLLAGEGGPELVDAVAASPELAAALVDLERAQAQVAADLAGLPEPEVPAGLADRIAAALAAAGPYVAEPPAARPHAAPGSDVADAERRPAAARSAVTGQPAGSVVPLRRPRAARSPRLLKAAAGVVGLLAVGVGLSALPDRSASDDSAASSAGGSAEAASAGPAVSASGSDYGSDPAQLQAALPDLLAGRGTPTDSSAREQGSLGADVERRSLAPAEPGAAPADPLARLRDPVALDACLSALAAPGEPAAPTALDYASYEGQPALVVVLPTQAPGAYDVFVVGAGCTAGADGTLFFARVTG